MSIKKRLFSFILAITLLFTVVPWTGVSSSASYPGELQFNENGKFRVMQLTDIHAPKDKDVNSRTIALITNMVTRYNPDLVVFTGDNVVGGQTLEHFKSVVNAFTQPIIDAGTDRKSVV